MIDRHTIKLADFGRACLQGSDVDAKVYGVIPYMDPKALDPKTPYNLTKKSDIYSLGVLFWQLTSCGSYPYNYFKEKTGSDVNLADYSLMIKIINGKRETPIPNTNSEFVKLYQSKCN